MAGNTGAQAAGDGHRSCAPIVADQCRLLQTKYINEFQQVTPQRSKLTSAWRVVSQKASGQEAAQSRNQHSPARLSQTRCNS